MAYRLSKVALSKSINHLTKYGDTDVFPHLQELTFFRDHAEEIIEELNNLDLDSYNPESAMEALAPKSKYGFRITHQLSALDTLLFLAAVVEIGQQIETHRLPSSEHHDFSYRFSAETDGNLFLDNHTYKDWLVTQLDHVQKSLKIKKVVKTDISDFYARVNFHRLENLLDEAAPGHGAARYIKKSIKVIRTKQSFGLPVGGTAARILAELSLSDTDRALLENGITATRFVDDFRIYLLENEDPYDVLSFLAQQLGVNEGLALNAAKTSSLTRAEFLTSVKSQTTDIADQAEGEVLDALAADVYFNDNPDIEDIEALKAMNLLGFLQEEFDKEEYDVGRVKVIFRALKIAKPEGAVEYICENFSELTVFAKEVVLLMQALDEDFPYCFDNLSDTVIDCILEPPASSVQLIRTWLLEIFARDVASINFAQFKKIENLPTVLDKRQLHIIRGRLEAKNYFRMNKGNIGQMSRFEQSAFITGATCLPHDEFKNWIAALKPNFSLPVDQLFLKWVVTNRNDVLSKVGATSKGIAEYSEPTD
ncbi:reverse transcriptase (RNA-dependent DNA polymerase) [Yoonia maritima]|uniref:Reverse transcriptase (RNA-dependent DNA polymerase) n=1 Tax=Yoonia maritima TaxID=1435347 RepID=A0A2T0W2X8_9RHOB|nr:RNA-directed DNA polymerase [Yoonia maritima]PRY79543.1 reverse transcriptase (RNA-dependent DNA polymerase) [Yoonia maritima]